MNETDDVNYSDNADNIANSAESREEVSGET